MRLLFKKHQRLKTNRQFKYILSLKCCAGNDLALLYAAANNLNIPRFGVSVPKSAGSAVARNRLKRLARESFRLEQHNLPPGFDYLLIFPANLSKKPQSQANSALKSISLETLRGWLLSLAQKAVRKAKLCDNPDL